MSSIPKSIVASLAGLLGLAAAVVLASPARANGRFPAANHLVSQPGRPETMVLRATYGMLVSRDAGVTWRWVCERAIGYNGAEDPALAIFPSGRVVAGLFKGLSVSDDGGCNWRFVPGPLEGQVVIDEAQWPNAPDKAVALTSSYAGEVAGSPRYKNEVHLTEDGGTTWTKVGIAIDSRAISETIEVAASDPNRLYVSAIRGENRAREGLLFVSHDRGKHWVERRVPLALESERAPFLAAVDAKNADRIYVRTSGPEKNRLLVSDDAGAHFRVAFAGGPLLGFALGREGTPSADKVFVGGPKDGLHQADTKELVFTQRTTKAIECLAFAGNAMFACSNEANGFILGRSDDLGATFEPLLHLAGMRGPLTCDGNASMNVCAPEWAQLKLEFNMGNAEGDAPRDAGAAADDRAGPDAGASRRTTPKRCSCRVAGDRAPRPPEAPWFSLGLVVLGVRRATRRCTMLRTGSLTTKQVETEQSQRESPLAKERPRTRWNAEIVDRCQRARRASRIFAKRSTAEKNALLRTIASELRARTDSIRSANDEDVRELVAKGGAEAMIDRLRLDAKRIESIAKGVEEVAALADPVGEVVSSTQRPNGLHVLRVRVPLGVVAMIYESRPNVTIDASALCLKTGNAVVLRGGSEAIRSNRALAEIVGTSLASMGMPEDAAYVIPFTDREAVRVLVRQTDSVDLAIPRGGETLIRFVTENALVPVVQHYKGVCHLFVDAESDRAMALRLVEMELSRPGVCNALECLLVDSEIAGVLLPEVAATLAAAGAVLQGCERTRAVVPSALPAQADDFGREFLDKVLAVKVVDGFDDALAHIERYGSGHTESICTSNSAHAERFRREVDAACVVVNASTRFHDGGELGLGAEIGIATSRLHWRGPMGLESLTTMKWVVDGNGQIRR